MGPQYIRVLRQEPGIEFFDLVLTLNPSLLKQTKTEYVYVESASSFYQQLPQLRKDDLSNSSYFQKLISINEKNSINEKEVFYALYK
ncbi:MAG: hypothetical protein M1365_16375, partial [Actinobacteria bacterium]|nr:hypothetical protein [Actinomycetota bacterium]